MRIWNEWWHPGALWAASHLRVLLGLSIVGGLAGLDAMAAFQVMLSRPLVLGGIVGWLLGDTGSGLLQGCLLELLWVNVLPVGAFVPPDIQFSTIFSVGGTLLLRERSAGAAPPAAAASFFILASIPLAFFSGLLELKLRRLNVIFCHWTDRQVDRGHTASVGMALLASMVSLFAKGFFVVLGSLTLLVPPAGMVLGHLPLVFLTGLTWAYWMTLLLGLLLAVDLFWDRSSAAAFFSSFGLVLVANHLFKASLHWVLPFGVLTGVAAHAATRNFRERMDG
jgi:mannose/fructose/N-acetylgalactosamine-specific phosphotransferase system component IIC